jgi:CRP-like cAMP-binding protein
MAYFDQSKVRNRLLGRLSPEAFEALRPSMIAIELPVRHTIVEANVRTGHVCFVERGLASVVAVAPDVEGIEVGHIGSEGMSGAHVMLKVDRTPNKTFMQVAGDGISVSVAALNMMTTQVPGSLDLFLRYVHCAEVQLAYSALANARYKMHERLARWLLMCHDRLSTDDLPLTHEFLSLMLGVRRSGITNELHIIEGMRVIKATRGNIRVLSRDGLKEIAGGSYGMPEQEYERLIGSLPRGRPS